MGNAVPHRHAHLLSRYVDDPAPGAPFPWDLVSASVPLEEEVLEAQVDAQRRVVGARGG